MWETRVADRPTDYSYLCEDDPDDAAGNLELSERDTALVIALPDLDYNSQLIAIRELLDRHSKVEAEQAAEIRKAKQLVEKPGHTRYPGDPFVVALEEDARQQNWIDHMHYLVYQDAARSMAAVGLVAPFVESIFHQSFRNIEREMNGGSSLPNDHERWQRPAEDQWDCHYVWKRGRRSANLAEGILQLVDAVGTARHMPNDLNRTLSALFEYRNKMFHCGFEWPMEERQRFCKRLSEWPEDWFSMATLGGEPWVFYMSPTLVAHCLDGTEKIIGGIGRFCKERL